MYCLKAKQLRLMFTTSIRKKVAAQNGAPGIFNTTSGYVKNTNPGPLFTTLATSVCCSAAKYPKIEKVTTPARSDVKVLITQVIRESLKSFINIRFYFVITHSYL